MTDAYRIRRMSRHEMTIAIDWAADEGWNPGLFDAECFYPTDPNGFFIGLLGDQPIAVGSAVCYDDSFAFCGFYIVSPEHRGQGYGMALTQARLRYVGERNAGIDGVINMLDNYARLGYRVAHNNARYQMDSRLTPASVNPAIQSIDTSFLPMLNHYDRAHFPASRQTFLSAWIHQPGSAAFMWFEAGYIKGYGVIRPCRSGFKIGPLFADTPSIADQLFQALASHAKGDNLYLDIPTNNMEANALVNRYQMTQVFETARMYLKGEPTIKQDEVYGITTFELG